ncbi:MAG TPA: ABC transporter permease [Pyrinomonadaceae bacterium]|nr:ABC transporter permease [Pyrinomonadaceae bacterium]
MGTLIQDLRYALRMLWKNLGFTSVAIVALALGIGANTTIFSAVNALLLRPFNFANPDSLVVMWERPPGTEYRNMNSPANFLDVREQNTTFSHVAVYNTNSMNLTEGDKPERLEVAAVSPVMFDALGARPLMGRTFAPEEEQDGRNKVAVLTHEFWRRRYASDPSIVNRQLMLNGQSYTVVGIMPEDFNFPPNNSDLLIPFTITDKLREGRGSHYVRVLGRLKPGVSRAQADADLAAIAARLTAAYPDTNSNRTIATESLQASYVRGPRPGLLVLLGASGFVLLLACANVANLLLVRAAARHKEIAIRMALGASRFRLVRQLLTESVLLSLLGGALGLLCAVWGIDLMKAGIPASLARYLPGWKNVGIDTPVFLFTFGVSIFTGVVFGLAPALQATKTNFSEALKDGGRTSGGGFSRNRLRGALIVAEVAISLTLLIGAGLMIKSFYEILKVEPGFKPESVLALGVSLPPAKYEQKALRANFYRQAVERVSALPGVEQAGAVNVLPLSRSNSDSGFYIVGRPKPEQGHEPAANFRIISPNYLEAMGIPLRRGRYITPADNDEKAPRVILISELLAERHFPNEEPLGKRIYFDSENDKESFEIVGIVGNIRNDSLVEEVVPELYMPLAQEPWFSMDIVVRSATGDPLQLAGAVQREVQAIDKDQPVFNVRTMERVVSESLAPQRVVMGMLGIFALIALVLASVGIYAVMSYAVTQRTHEIGIRMALGAQPRDILKMVVRQGMILALAGVAIGLIASYWVTQGMNVILYDVSATDPTTFGLVSLLLVVVAFAANYIPARRATKVDPMIALRYE